MPTQPTANLGSTASSLLSAAQGLGISGLASALGGNSDLNYFGALLSSRTLAENVLLHPLPRGLYPSDSTATNLLAVYGVDPSQFEYGLAQGVKRFGARLDVNPDPASGVISIVVSAPGARLAQFVGKITLKYLDDLNASINRRAAVAQLRLAEQQLAGAQRSLLDAEDSLERFYIANRAFGSSPTLTFQEGRLKRRVDLAQSVFVMLSQQYEQAKLNATSNLPSFTVVDEPNVPPIRAFPKRRKSVVAATVLVALALSIAAFARGGLFTGSEPAVAAVRTVRTAAASTLTEMAGTYRRLVGRDRRSV